MGRFTDWIKEKLGITPKRIALPEAQVEIPHVPNNDFIASLKNVEISQQQKADREQEIINKQQEKARQKDLIFGYEVMKNVMFIAESEDFRNITKSVRKEEGNHNPINLDEADYAILADIQKRRYYYQSHAEEPNVMAYLEKSDINMLEVVNETKQNAIKEAKNKGETLISPQVIRKYIGNTAEVARRMIENEKYDPRMD